MRTPKFYKKLTEYGTNQYSAIWYPLGIFFQKSSDGKWTIQKDPVSFLDFRVIKSDAGRTWNFFFGPFYVGVAKVG